MSSASDFISQLSNEKIFAPEGSDITMAEWTAPGTVPGEKPEKIAPLHRHFNDDEAWYVLKGSLHFTVGHSMVEANAGQAVIIPKGVPHTFWNPEEKEAKYLIIMTKTIKQLVDAIHASNDGDREQMVRIFESHSSELLE